MKLEMNEAIGRALKACKRHFGYALFFSALANLLYLVPMLYMLQVYERVVPTRGHATLLLLTLMLLFALLTLSSLDVIRSRLLVRAGVRLDRLLSGAIFDATLARSDPSGQRLARQAVREFDTLRQALTGPAIVAVLDAPWMPVYVLVAFLLHPWLGVLSLVGAAVVIALAWLNEQVTRDRLQRANEAAGRAYADFETIVGSADVVRALGMREAMVASHLSQRSSMMRLQTDASMAASGVTTASKTFRQLLQSLALGVGALLAIDGKISPGAIFAGSLIVGRALSPIDQMVGNWRTILSARGAWRTLNRLLDETPPEFSHTQLPRPAGRLEVEQLHVFSPTREPILNNISFEIPAGEVVAIVGPSGAGKSTLVRALAGAISAEHGVIRFDGADQRNWDPERLAEHVGFMPQEPALFSGTIKENIARFRNRLGEDRGLIDTDVIAAATAAGAHDLIQRLPGGYDTLLGLGGQGLSAGQGQRVALARALFRGPAVLILDEPNSNLDAEGDHELARCLEQAKTNGTTVILVAHRMSMLPIVDRLMVIQAGRLAAYGPRDEVLAKIAPPRQPIPAQQKGVAS
ncbi:type I secretion system permease/ATPase [Sphingomonas sp. KRR8]|uniref:type I secretion system permease/ATPase n=1 Tax=Sphingomonas sp. KRR8 TaxID=2942996 RepID=UPI0020202BEB|nr:type I secretion system permease/ATPase [Sphingomonas sp. KRR8]URD61545.1 type I secretion system permease/ATPase [Sphingomonas sp. KRR8]